MKDEEAFITKSHDLVALTTLEDPYPVWVKELLEYNSYWSMEIVLKTEVTMCFTLEKAAAYCET